MHVLSRAGALPRGASRRAVVPNCHSNPSHSQLRGKRSAEIRGRGTPHPLARLAAEPVPPAGGNCRSITRTGAPFGAPLRRFSLDLGTAFWKRTGAPIRTPLIPRGFPRFHPLHQPVAGRTHVVGPGDVSRGPRRPGWLGRTLRRRIPPRSHAPHENALGRVGRRIGSHPKEQIKNIPANCGWAEVSLEFE